LSLQSDFALPSTSGSHLVTCPRFFMKEERRKQMSEKWSKEERRRSLIDNVSLAHHSSHVANVYTTSLLGFYLRGFVIGSK